MSQICWCYAHGSQVVKASSSDAMWVCLGSRCWEGILFLRRLALLLGQTSTSGLAAICSWDGGQGHRAGLWAWSFDEEAPTTPAAIRSPAGAPCVPCDVPALRPVFQVFSLFSCVLRGAGFKMDDCSQASH